MQKSYDCFPLLYINKKKTIFFCSTNNHFYLRRLWSRKINLFFEIYVQLHEQLRTFTSFRFIDRKKKCFSTLILIQHSLCRFGEMKFIFMRLSYRVVQWERLLRVVASTIVVTDPIFTKIISAKLSWPSSINGKIVPSTIVLWSLFSKYLN